MDPANKALSFDTIHTFYTVWFMIQFENLLLYTMLLNLEWNLYEYAVIFPHVISVTWKDGLSCLSEELSSYPFSECNDRKRENESFLKLVSTTRNLHFVVRFSIWFFCVPWLHIYFNLPFNNSVNFLTEQHNVDARALQNVESHWEPYIAGCASWPVTLQNETQQNWC
jgi:hypothetical protein